MPNGQPVRCRLRSQAPTPKTPHVRRLLLNLSVPKTWQARATAAAAGAATAPAADSQHLNSYTSIDTDNAAATLQQHFHLGPPVLHEQPAGSSNYATNHSTFVRTIGSASSSVQDAQPGSSKLASGLRKAAARSSAELAAASVQPNSRRTRAAGHHSEHSQSAAQLGGSVHARAASKALHPAQLMHQIKSSSSAAEIFALLEEHGQTMNALHLTACLSTLAKLQGSSTSATPHPLHTPRPAETQARAHPAAQRILQLLQSHIADLKPRELSSVLWSCAKLSVTIDIATLASLFNRCSATLDSFNSQDVSMTLYALACLPSAPSSSFLTALVHASEPKLREFGAQALSNSLWALAKLGFKPSDRWLHAFADASVPRLPDCTPQALSNLLWACVQLDHTPPLRWQRAILVNAQLCLPGATPYAVAHMAWAVARLQLPAATSDWYRSILATAEFKLSSYSPTDLSNLIWAAATSCTVPHSTFMQSFLVAVASKLTEFSTIELSGTLRSLAQLQYRPPRRWLEVTLGLCQDRFGSCSAQSLSNILWAVTRLDACPGQQWMLELQHTLATKLDDCGPQEVANLWWSLGRLRYAPAPELTEGLLLEMRHRLSDMNGEELAMTLWGLAALRLRPPKLLLDRMMSQILASGPSVQTACTALRALVRLRATSQRAAAKTLVRRMLRQQLLPLPPSSGHATAIKHSYIDASTRHPDAMPQAQQAHANGHSNVVGHTNAKSSAHQHLTATGHAHMKPAAHLASGTGHASAHPQVQLMAVSQTATLLYCLARLGDVVPQRLLTRLCKQQVRLQQLASCSKLDVLQLSFAVRKMKLAPPSSWLQQCLHSVAATAKDYSDSELCAAFRTLARINQKHRLLDLRSREAAAALGSLLHQINARLPNLQIRDLVNVCSGTAMLQLQPSPEFVDRLMTCITRRLPATKPKDVTELICALSKMRANRQLLCLLSTLLVRTHAYVSVLKVKQVAAIDKAVRQLCKRLLLYSQATAQSPLAAAIEVHPSRHTQQKRHSTRAISTAAEGSACSTTSHSTHTQLPSHATGGHSRAFVHTTQTAGPIVGPDASLEADHQPCGLVQEQQSSTAALCSPRQPHRPPATQTGVTDLQASVMTDQQLLAFVNELQESLSVLLASYPAVRTEQRLRLRARGMARRSRKQRRLRSSGQTRRLLSVR